jgi:perosamine synthetase
MKRIPVAVPFLAENSSKYVIDALKDNELSGLFGKNIGKFEAMFAEFIGTKYAISCSSGTSALHLSLAASGIKKGDEVLVSSLTNMATFFAVMYCGAKPIPVDIKIDTYNIDTSDLEKKITSKTKAILIVHLFGQPCEMDPIQVLAKRHGLLLFEDCAESHGAKYKGCQTGSFGNAGCFSLFANKIVSTGEGGIITTNDSELVKRVQSLKSLAFGDTEKFIHKEVGFNYRMDNLKASLGVSQMEIVDDLVGMKISMGEGYDQLLAENKNIIIPVKQKDATNVYWMYLIRLTGKCADKRSYVIQRLSEAGIEVRQGFASYTLQPFCSKEDRSMYGCPVAESVSFNTLYLPSSHDISYEDQQYVCSTLTTILEEI